MAEDADAEPEGPADPHRTPLRQPDHRRALPAPPHSPSDRQLGPPAPEVDAAGAGNREPPADLVVSPGTLFVTLEIPGASEETVAVEATDARLTVTARGRDGFLYRRVVDLPESVDPHAVRTAYRNGVLDITIRRGAPKRSPKED